MLKRYVLAVESTQMPPEVPLARMTQVMWRMKSQSIMVNDCVFNNPGVWYVAAV